MCMAHIITSRTSNIIKELYEIAMQSLFRLRENSNPSRHRRAHPCKQVHAPRQHGFAFTWLYRVGKRIK